MSAYVGRVYDSTNPIFRSPGEQPATGNQIRYIRRLAAEQGTTTPTPEQELTWTRNKASEIISWYLQRKPAAPARPATVTVPDGRYAVAIDGDSEPLSFFLLETEDDETSRWHGFQYVNQLASDTRYPQKGARRHTVLAAIAADIEGASRTYGRESRHCGVCGRSLTTYESRTAGIGPRCLAKMGW